MLLLGIRTKLLISFCLLAMVPVALLGVLVSQRTEEILQQRVTREMQVEVVATAETLDTYLEGVRRDLLALTRFLQRRLSAQMSEERWQEMEEEFYQALQAENSYYQVRFIGSDGWEKLRINNVGGRLERVSRQQYQYKGDRYYVSETLRLAPGEIYLSPLDFNVEHGRIEEPRQLVARMATPAAGEDGRIQGIVVINIFGRDLLSLLEPVQPVLGSRLLLVGEKGGYVERRRNREGTEVLTGMTLDLSREFGLSLEELLDNPGPQVISEGQVFLATTPVRTGASTWMLMKTFPRRLLDQDLQRIQTAILIFALSLLLPVAGLAILTARSFSRPIAKLVDFAKAIAAGDYQQQVRHPSRDEFGQLTTALNRMATALDSSRQRLLHWNQLLQEEVANRTRELQNSEEKYRLIFSAGSDAILIIDTENFQLQEANEAACRLYGYERDELLHLDPLALSNEPETSRKRGGEILAGERTRVDLAWHRRKDGRVIPVSISAGIFSWQNRRMLVAIIRDISERQRIEELKDEMLAGISHEMCTPLTAVLGFLELLLDNAFDPQQQQHYLRICLREGERLQALIENLLALQRLRTGEALKLQRVEIGPLLEQQAGAFAASHDGFRLELECAEGLPAIEVDPELLHLALANLLANAARYGGSEKGIVLGATLEGGRVALRVEDRGPGIPQGLREDIFNRFFRLDFRDGSRIGGTGLGLPLVKEIAQVHGGEVRLESQEGEGSTFSILLPAAVIQPTSGPGAV